MLGAAIAFALIALLVGIYMGRARQEREQRVRDIDNARCELRVLVGQLESGVIWSKRAQSWLKKNSPEDIAVGREVMADSDRTVEKKWETLLRTEEHLDDLSEDEDTGDEARNAAEDAVEQAKNAAE